MIDNLIDDRLAVYRLLGWAHAKIHYVGGHPEPPEGGTCREPACVEFEERWERVREDPAAYNREEDRRIDELLVRSRAAREAS